MLPGKAQFGKGKRRKVASKYVNANETSKQKNALKAGKGTVIRGVATGTKPGSISGGSQKQEKKKTGEKGGPVITPWRYNRTASSRAARARVYQGLAKNGKKIIKKEGPKKGRLQTIMGHQLGGALSSAR